MEMNTSRATKCVVIGFAVALLPLLAPTGLAGDKAEKVDRENWKQAKSSNTIPGYLQYLRNTSSGYKLHEEEAKQQLKQLVQADLASVKEVSVITQGTDAAGQKLLNAGLMKLTLEALGKQGFHVVEGDAPNEVLISVSQNRFLSGSPDSYWHFAAAEVMSVNFSRKGIGPIFRNNVPQDHISTDPKVYTFPSIRVKPLATDQRPLTYISPDTGQAWGAGVQFTMGSNDPAVIAADQKALQDYNWAALVDCDAELPSFRKSLETIPLLRVDPMTQWVF